METRAASDKGAVVDLNVSGKQAIIRDYNAVPQKTIVSEMGPDH
jgi:hypothetical protein